MHQKGVPGRQRLDHRHINTESDSEVLLNVLAHEIGETTRGLPSSPNDLFEAVRRVHRRVKGSYAVIALIAGHGVLAFRDPFGIRPLCMGLAEDTVMLASESVTLEGTGIALDGVLYFPPEPVGRITTYHNVAPLDATGGHTGFAYDYHYHRAREVPGVPNLRTRVYGFMFDGYPIYGATEPDGSAVRDLDRCQGHVTARLGYHYHASNACLNGAVATGMSRVG